MEPKSNRGVLPAAILGGSAAGALAALIVMRREAFRLRSAAERLKPEAVMPPAPQGQAQGPAPAAAKPEKAEEISPEILSVISAVVAAFYGKSARIRSVRQFRPTPSPWAQEGRVSVQASHQLARL